MEEPQSTTPPPDKTPKDQRLIQFNQLKSAHYRTIHADGFICGITPKGNLCLTVYNERASIPQVVIHPLGEDGALTDPVHVSGKSGYVRELDVTIMMSLEILRSLLSVLEGKIEKTEKIATRMRARSIMRRPMSIPNPKPKPGEGDK